jgi:autotransporter-associated beta strand protein
MLVVGACGAAIVASLGWGGGALHAEPRSWDGGGTGDDWLTPQNWNPDGVPASTTDVVLGGFTPSVINARDMVGGPANLFADFVTISTGNAFTVDGRDGGVIVPVDFSTLTLTTGDLTRQELFGIGQNQTLDLVVALASDGLWQINGEGELHVTALDEPGSTPIGLTKTGSGVLQFGVGVDLAVGEIYTYTGPTTISQGVLRILDGIGGLGTSAISVASGAQLQINSVTTSAPTTLAGGGVSSTGALKNVGGLSTLSGLITLAGDTVFSSDGSGTLALSGDITDGASSFSVTKVGSGILSITAAGTYDGGTLVDAGTLLVGHNSALGTGLVTVEPGAVLELVDAVAIANAVDLGGMMAAKASAASATGTVTIVQNAVIDVANGATLTLTGPVTDNNNGRTMTKSGEGTLALSGAHTVSGALTVAAGTLRTLTALPPGVTTTVQAGATLELQNNLTIDRPLEISGTGAGGVGALHSVSGTNRWSGPVTLSADTTVRVGANRLIVSGGVSGGFTVTKMGPGEFVLTGNNSYGDSAINEGILTIQSNGALPAGRTATIAEGAVLQIANNISTSPTASLRLNGLGTVAQGALSNTQGANTFAGSVKFITDTAINTAAGTTLTISGIVSDDVAPLPLVKSGPGTLVLSGANTYRGGTIVNGGALSINGNARLGDTSGPVTLNNGAKLSVTANMTTARTFNLNTGSIQPNAAVTLTYNGATVSGGFLRGPGTHAITGAASNFSGVTALAGSNILQNAATTLTHFTNSGTLTSSAALTWDGGYNTAAGQLNVNSTLSTSAFENNGTIIIGNAATLSNSGNNLVSSGGSIVNVNDGGTIQLNATSLDLHGALAVNDGAIIGTVNVYYGSLAKGTGTYGTVNVLDGGKFSPADSPGDVNVSGDYTQMDGAALLIELAGTTAGVNYDSATIAGIAMLDGTLDVSLIDDFVPSAGNSFEILTATGGVAGHFDTEMLPALSGGMSWNVIYGAGSVVIQVAAPGLTGDFNNDGTVDAADYVVWRKNPGGIYTPDDYNIWRANFAQSFTASDMGSIFTIVDPDSAVPEPPSALLLLFAALGVWRHPRGFQRPQFAAVNRAVNRRMFYGLQGGCVRDS